MSIDDVLAGKLRWHVEHGDSLDVMPRLPDACLDVVVTDPPYGLSGTAPDMVEVLQHWLAGDDAKAHHGRVGMMGKAWDSFVPGPATWKEHFRLLKPGGHMFVFGGTRTYDLLTLAIRLAGFEIRECLQWLYGCLSEDTEILVDGRWEHYSKATEGRRALCYDAEHGTYSWQVISHLHVYPYADTAYRVVSDHTDQIVSRNHRCLVERGGRLILLEAEACQREEIVPVLENVQRLLIDLSVPHEGVSSPQSSLSSLHGGFQEAPQAPAFAQSENSRMRSMRAFSREAGVMAQACQSASVLVQLQREAEGGGVGEAFSQGSVGLDRRVMGELLGQDDRCQQSSMERRSNSLAVARQLQASEVCALPAGAASDGSEGWVRDGASDAGCHGNRSSPLLLGGGPPRGSRSTEQQPLQPGAFREQQRTQAIRGERYTTTTLARVEPVRYDGIVWCVTVPTGAFVARRNGKVFVTGNSGFPKSHDISKAIDKAAGAEREVVGVRADFAARANKKRVGVAWVGEPVENGSFSSPETVGQITAPSTEAAKQWAGWGTALKPCYEPILVARKPLIGTVAANVLAHGTGALNIAACRVSFASKADEAESKKKNQHADFGSDSPITKNSYGDYGTERPNYDAPGRWPSNILLQHSASCVLAEQGRECDASCPVAELDRQSGITTSGAMKREVPAYDGESNTAFLRGRSGPSNQHGGTGGASRFFNTFEVDPDDINTARFIYQAKASKSDRNAGCSGITNTHPTVKPTAILRHLVKLGCPPGGVVGDFFNGSGSTGRAAVLEGFRYVGCELNDTEAEPYVTIARQRIAAAVSESTPTTPPTPPKQGGLFDD